LLQPAILDRHEKEKPARSRRCALTEPLSPMQVSIELSS
jgi:hypothetical protein